MNENRTTNLGPGKGIPDGCEIRGAIWYNPQTDSMGAALVHALGPEEMEAIMYALLHANTTNAVRPQ